MLYSYNTEKLLGIKDVIIKNIETNNKSNEIYIEIPVKEQKCPCCSMVTKRVHDYRTQKIRDICGYGKQTIIVLRKRRYRCLNCGKCFYEKVSFLPKYQRMTRRLVEFVIDELRNESSFTSVAKRMSLSVSTVIRIFDIIEYGKPKLPKVLSIDEFKGSAGSEKYQCIITDPENRVVLDILPKRYSYYLTSYFKDMDKKNVEFFVSDMWKWYAEIADTCFKNSVQIVDKYHYIRQVIWAFEAIRKEVQKMFNKTHRKYFKRSKSLLVKRFDYLTDEQKQQVNVMLYVSPKLCSAHFLKELFFKVLDTTDKDTAKKLMSEWILAAQASGIPNFKNCANTFINWSKGILNSFDYPYTNGFTEGCNNKIKVLKRNAYGYRNFNRFRKRILHMFSHQKDKIMAVV